jgi:hypothetical protein
MLLPQIWQGQIRFLESTAVVVYFCEQLAIHRAVNFAYNEKVM